MVVYSWTSLLLSVYPLSFTFLQHSFQCVTSFRKRDASGRASGIDIGFCLSIYYQSYPLYICISFRADSITIGVLLLLFADSPSPQLVGFTTIILVSEVFKNWYALFASEK